MKYMFAVMFALLMCAPFGCSAEAVTHNESVVVTQEFYEQPSFDPNTNYMEVMIRAASECDEELLAKAVTARNNKIKSLGLSEKLLTVNEFLCTFREYAGFDWDRNYLEEMKVCAATGNLEHGRICARERTIKIQTLGLDELPIDFDELYLLAKVITNEAGSNWLPMEWKMAVGEVLLNRVASPEFPDTMEECVYQPSQYSGSNTKRFAEMVPWETCIEAAARLLSGERVLDEPSVVFQANFPQGSGVFLKLTDSRLGNTYLCYSNRRELYS